MECILILNKIGANNRVTLRWVPGHCGINGNEEADELARLGAESLPLGPEPIIGLPKCTSRREIKDWAQNQSLEAWNNVPGQHHARALIVGYSQKFTRRALELTRNQLRVLTRTLSGHCRLNSHLHKMGLSDTPTCRFCNEEDETPMHILCECEAIIHKRNRILGGYKLAPIDVRSLSPGKIIRFIKDLGLDSRRWRVNVVSIATRPTAVTLDATYGVNRRPGPYTTPQLRRHINLTTPLFPSVSVASWTSGTIPYMAPNSPVKKDKYVRGDEGGGEVTRSPRPRAHFSAAHNSQNYARVASP
ncbi:unnamed protein product [Plutella xylostella]|uniref:(diamondback moth) hypothetical protein n=1 Tax=Plutella xylostella TaxID=51655 RepID=A0A8S4GDZ4_PLUXY|nr:unnamed protein product [Plutella xylostella]